MAFVLKVSKGPDAGTEFPVDGSEAKLGRTNDNDIVVADAAASRSHARVYEDSLVFWVEDLGSANGTVVNGRRIGEPTPLSNGDTITIGDIELTFVLPDATLLAPPTDMPEAPAEDPNATMIKMPEELEAAEPDATIPPQRARPASKKTPARRPTRPPRPADTADDEEEEEQDEPQPQDTADDEDEAEGPVPDEGPPPDTTKNFNVPPPRALSRRESPAAAKRSASSLRKVQAEPDQRDEASAMTAAERARQRRELSRSAGGKLQLVFMDLPKPARLLVTVLGGALGLGVVALLVFAVLPKARGPKRVEPMQLGANAAPIADSFGVGDGVTFEKADMKSFEFTMASPTRVVGVLHYMAKDVSKDEVAIVLNGAELGTVPPDSLDADTRELDRVLPADILNPRESNTVAFDNVNNPPAEDPWRVWNIWVEIIPVPELSLEMATARAREDIEKAQKYYDQKDIGAENLFRAWKTYREAWLVLEATPNRPDDLLGLARSRMRDLRPELDQKCSAILVEYKKLTANGQWDEARAVLEHVPSYFPTKEHPCYNFSKAILAQDTVFESTE